MTSITGDIATIIIIKGIPKCKAIHVTGCGVYRVVKCQEFHIF
jgi:hypothetical protein